MIDCKKPNKAAKAARDEFEKILKETKSIFALDDTVLNKVITDYENEKKQNNFVETTEGYTFSPDKKDSRTDKINEYLSKKFNKKEEIMMPYKFYFNVYFAKEHFVGPGEKGPSTLKNKNLGELCTQFGDSDASSEL